MEENPQMRREREREREREKEPPAASICPSVVNVKNI
jgi:hypothetical protein